MKTGKTNDLDFLATWDKNDKQIINILHLANKLRKNYYRGQKINVFSSGLGISIFRDQSTRTRYSFAAACNLLGLANQELEEGKSQITHGETVLETANMISFATRAIGIRDDIFLGTGHRFMTQVSRAVQSGFDENILAFRPSVINLQSDRDHPTQSMSDLLHLINYFGGINRLKGKKITISWAYSPSYGKPLSVPQGAIALLTRFGMKVILSYPPGYNLIPKIEKLAAQNARKSKGSFETTNNMSKAFSGADIVYPKSWAPFNIMKNRTKLLAKNDLPGLKKLEKKALSNNAKFKKWTCSNKMMGLTKNGKALYMHCLPADISGVSCKQGEVSSQVFSKYRRQCYLQASYKPFVIAAMIMIGQKKAL